MGLIRAAAGRLATAALEGLARLPAPAVLALAAPLLPLYAACRPSVRAKLRALPSSMPPVGTSAYYRMRLCLAHLSVRPATETPDPTRVEIRGGELFAEALSSGRPVVLFGWHQGPVELLHRVPADAMQRAGRAAGFFLVTAAAFAPALSAWMTARRARDGVRVLRPGDRGPLRDWARGGGVLAVMIDQVPGGPEDRLRLHGGAVSVPWPRRFVTWIEARRPVRLAVSALREPGGRIVFRYDRLDADAAKDGIAPLMDEALARAPEQYNWSYGKCRVAAGR